MKLPGCWVAEIGGVSAIPGMVASLHARLANIKKATRMRVRIMICIYLPYNLVLGAFCQSKRAQNSGAVSQLGWDDVFVDIF